MNSKSKGKKRKLAASGSLFAAGKANAKSVEDFVNRELAKVLKKRKLKKIKLKGAIFSHLENGLVVSGPVPLPDNMTRTGIPKTTLPVGFLVNTLRLIDPVSRQALEPGATLVELRPLRGGDFAFDYIGGDGKVKMATDTHRSSQAGDRLGLSDPGGSQHFDIEVNHVIRAPTIDDPLPCPYVCTSYHDGREKCYYACEDDGDLGFAIG